MTAGRDIFAAAIKSLLDQPVAALSLLAVFTVLDFGIRLLSYSEIAGVFPMIVALPIAPLVLVGVIASTWHRIVLLPGAAPTQTGRALHYTLAWCVLGIVSFILLAPLALLLYGIILVMAPDDPLLWQSLVYFGSSEYGVYVFALFSIPFLWLLYRIGLGLPNLAIGRKDLSFRESWSRTSPLGGAIFGLAVIAGIVQTPILFAYLPFLPSEGELDAFYAQTGNLSAQPPGSIVADWVGAFTYGLIVVVGAAILTELHRRTEPAA